MSVTERRRFTAKFSKLASRFGLGPGKRMTAEAYRAAGLSVERLHLGCGNVHIPGWCNIDGLRTGATDLICDIRTLAKLPESCAREIYACHVLEHFAHSEVPAILKNWFRVLKNGGLIRISVPDLDAITRIYQANLAHFQIPGHQPWIALLYGGQKDEYDFHRTGFNFCWLKYLLEQAGYREVETYPQFPHFIVGLHDDSVASAPFGEFISLNVLAHKP